MPPKLKGKNIKPEADDKKSEQDDEMSEAAEEKAALAAILKKLDENSIKLNSILTSQCQQDIKISELKNKFDELQKGVQSMSLDVEELKRKTELKADLNELDNLRKEMRTKMDNLENRSKRNNIVLWNTPEGSEKGDVVGFLYDFLQPIWTYTLLRTYALIMPIEVVKNPVISQGLSRLEY